MKIRGKEMRIEENHILILLSISLLNMISSVIRGIGEIKSVIGIEIVLIYVVEWLKTIIEEKKYQGKTNSREKVGILQGYIYFIVSEIMIFVSLFVAIIYLNYGESSYISEKEIMGMSKYGLSFTNIIILILSSIYLEKEVKERIQ